MRNLTANAFKALDGQRQPRIEWRAVALSDGRTTLSIQDNGPGVNADSLKALYDDTAVIGIRTGLGLHLIRDLAAAIDCTIEVESQPGGTVFTLTL